MSAICRLCLRNDQHVTKENIFNILISEALCRTFDIEIKINDNFSKLICQKCLQMVKYVLKLKEFFKVNQYLLKENKCPPGFDIEESELKVDVGTQTEYNNCQDEVRISLDTLAAINTPRVLVKKLEKSDTTKIYRKMTNVTYKMIQKTDTTQTASYKGRKKTTNTENPIGLMDITESHKLPALDILAKKSHYKKGDHPTRLNTQISIEANTENPIELTETANNHKEITPLGVLVDKTQYKKGQYMPYPSRLPNQKIIETDTDNPMETTQNYNKLTEESTLYPSRLHNQNLIETKNDNPTKLLEIAESHKELTLDILADKSHYKKGESTSYLQRKDIKTDPESPMELMELNFIKEEPGSVYNQHDIEMDTENLVEPTEITNSHKEITSCDILANKDRYENRETVINTENPVEFIKMTKSHREIASCNMLADKPKYKKREAMIGQNKEKIASGVIPFNKDSAIYKKPIGYSRNFCIESEENQTKNRNKIVPANIIKSNNKIPKTCKEVRFPDGDTTTTLTADQRILDKTYNNQSVCSTQNPLINPNSHCKNTIIKRNKLFADLEENLRKRYKIVGPTEEPEQKKVLNIPNYRKNNNHRIILGNSINTAAVDEHHCSLQSEHITIFPEICNYQLIYSKLPTKNTGYVIDDFATNTRNSIDHNLNHQDTSQYSQNSIRNDVPILSNLLIYEMLPSYVKLIKIDDLKTKQNHSNSSQCLIKENNLTQAFEDRYSTRQFHNMLATTSHLHDQKNDVVSNINTVDYSKQKSTKIVKQVPTKVIRAGVSMLHTSPRTHVSDGNLRVNTNTNDYEKKVTKTSKRVTMKPGSKIINDGVSMLRKRREIYTSGDNILIDTNTEGSTVLNQINQTNNIVSDSASIERKRRTYSGDNILIDTNTEGSTVLNQINQTNKIVSNSASIERKRRRTYSDTIKLETDDVRVNKIQNTKEIPQQYLTNVEADEFTVQTNKEILENSAQVVPSRISNTIQQNIRTNEEMEPFAPVPKKELIVLLSRNTVDDFIKTVKIEPGSDLTDNEDLMDVLSVDKKPYDLNKLDVIWFPEVEDKPEEVTSVLHDHNYTGWSVF